ncbi:hypothetical protein MPF_0064 [Methanohalophilus portucalensis FDF-1]|nr:hypothetical protein MPF_0064 [Methanohalophilus portucalensis FDF-1]
MHMCMSIFLKRRDYISYLSFFYLKNEFRKTPGQLLRQLLVLTIVFSIALTLILVPIRFEHEQLSPLEKANYDIFVNGEITKYDHSQLLKGPNIVDSAVGSYGSGKVYNGNISDTYIETTIPVNTLLLDSETLKNTSKLEIIGLDHFLISGNIESGYLDFRSVLVGWNIAKRLDVNIGDTIIYWVGSSKYVYKITGITIPTSETEFIIEDTRPIDLIAEDEELAGNLYIASSNQEATFEYIQAYMTKNEKDWVLTTKEEQLNRAATELKELLPLTIRIVFFSGGLLLHLTILLREQNIAIDSKKRNFSILTSLGASKKQIMKIYTIEQILVMVCVLFLALIVTKYLIYQLLFELYLPIEVGFQGIMIGLVVYSIAVIIALLYSHRKISKIPIAKLLKV